jgi:hypothetical protein
MPVDKRRKGKAGKHWHEGAETAMRARDLQVGQWTNGNDWCWAQDD